VYHHFAGKPALFRAVLDEVEGEAQQRAAAAGMGAGSPVEAILAGVDAYLDAALSPEVQRITLIDAPAVLGPDPWDETTAREAHAALATLIATAIADGALMDVDPDALAHLIGGSCLHAATQIARSAHPADTRAAFGRTLRALIEGLRPHG
jgi:AcrR family transcriptional regulator